MKIDEKRIPTSRKKTQTKVPSSPKLTNPKPIQRRKTYKKHNRHKNTLIQQLINHSCTKSIIFEM